MLRSAQVFTQLEYRLASRLMQAPWLEGSAHKRRLTMHLFRRCANAGHVDALSTYGVMLFRRGQSARDKARGVRCVVKAAEAGHPEAQYQVGHMYEHGCTQFARREDRAVTWYARAAEAGHAGAAQRLAHAFDYGELGLPVDPARSHHWHQAEGDTAAVARQMISVPARSPALQ